MGTAQALAACAAMHCLDSNMAQRAAGWMVATQTCEWRWGPPRTPVDYSGNEREGNLRSWREKRGALEILQRRGNSGRCECAFFHWLGQVRRSNEVSHVASCGSPMRWSRTGIGSRDRRFLFIQIWYHERLYPLAFAAVRCRGRWVLWSLRRRPDVGTLIFRGPCATAAAQQHVLIVCRALARCEEIADRKLQAVSGRFRNMNRCRKQWHTCQIEFWVRHCSRRIYRAIVSQSTACC